MLQKNIDCFLSKYRECSIAIYGTGLNAERVLRNVKGYRFNYVISSDTDWIGCYFEGIKVEKLENVIEYIDVILIAAVPSITRIIYERIKEEVPQDIVIFDMMGNQLNKKRNFCENEYWRIRKTDLIAAIDMHDVISFDIFDTLLMRRFLFPNTVFKIVSRYVEERGWTFDFFELRTDAEKQMYVKGMNPTLNDIYNQIEKNSGISCIQLDKCKELEIKIEKENLILRKDVAEAFHYAVNNGKKVYITSDMYLPKKVLDSALAEKGIKGYIEILVSCEEKSSKQNGGLYKHLKDIVNDESIIHIGDDLYADIEMAAANDIDTFYVMSAKDLFLHSSAAHLLSYVHTAEDEILLGVILGEIFGDAFLLGETKGSIMLNTIDKLAKICLAPITMQFVGWLVESLRRKEKDIVLFVSRDGYYLEKLYRKIQETHPELKLPVSQYFYTSRKIMNEAVAQDVSDIAVLLSTIDEYRKSEAVEYVERLFQIPFSEELSDFCGRSLNKVSYDELVQSVAKHKEKIFSHSVNVRRNYKTYIHSTGIMDYQDVYLVDLVSHGTSRYGLSRIVGKEVYLLALGTTKLPNAFVKDKAYVNSLYGEMIIGAGSVIGTMFAVLELAYSSKDGQAMGFDKKGQVIFDKKTKYNEFLLEKIQKSIAEFIEFYPDRKWFSYLCSKDLAEALLGLLDAEVSDISDDVKNLFDFSDLFQEKRQKYNVLKLIRGEVDLAL